MKTILLLVRAAAVLAAILAVSCMPTQVKTELDLERDGARWVTRMMSRMPLEDKVAQMIGCRYSGDFLPADGDELTTLERLVAKHKIGSLAIFLGGAYETAILNNALQARSEIPLLIGSDLERGAGNQITGATLFPTIMGLGAADSEALAYAMGRATALEGRAVGIHMTYAPVADVNVNPDNPIINTRAVGEDPEQVGRIAVAFIRGCQDNGMLATAKHFPGHGDTDLDSHILLPVIAADRARLERVELPPFRKAVEAGVGAMMIAHLVVPALDPEPRLPASLSFVVQTELLRKSMGFKGLIVTDAMDMGGVTSAYAPAEAALKAIQAGADIVLLSPEPENVLDALKDAARRGVLSTERIDASARRILEAKARLGLHRNRYVDVASLPRKLSARETLTQARKTFEAAATLVKNAGGLLPLSPGGKKTILLSLSSDRGDYYAGRFFGAEMIKRDPGTEILYADGDTGQETLDAMRERAASADVVVCAIFSSLSARKGTVGIDSRHSALIRALVERGKPVAALSFGSPYFLRDFAGVAAYMCFYRNQPPMQEVAARALYGEFEVNGRLPVSLPGLFPAGHGLILKK